MPFVFYQLLDRPDEGKVKLVRESEVERNRGGPPRGGRPSCLTENRAWDRPIIFDAEKRGLKLGAGITV
jgi:hypothetical protein